MNATTTPDPADETDQSENDDTAPQIDPERLALAMRQLSMAKINLMTRPESIFISTIAFSLRHEFATGRLSTQISTAGTDARTIWYNVDFWLSLNARQQLGLLLHEVWHVAFDHCRALGGNRGAHNATQGLRREQLGKAAVADIKGQSTEFNDQLWNVACDHVINLMLDASGDELPEGGCMDERFKDMSAEDVYICLIGERKAIPNNYVGDLHEISGNADDHRQQLDDTLVQAAMKSEMSGEGVGSIPGSLALRIQALRTPSLPWDRVLMRYFNAKVKSDWSFAKPNRRFFPEHHLPSAHSEALGRVAMAIDMSGSVSDEEIDQFVSDVSTVVTRLPVEELTLVQFDTRIQGEHRIRTRQDLLDVDFSGRGGTDVRPVIDWANEHRPDVLVIFTDGYFALPEEPPGCPVVWVIHDNEAFVPRFGDVIHYTIDAAVL